MQKTTIQLPEFKLVGLAARTNNTNETSSETAKIGITIQKYFHDELIVHVTQRAKPGTTYCVYAEYETDVSGEYTYFVGEQVNNFDFIPDGLSILNIPAQNYIMFTPGPGKMPDVCISAWQQIWGMTTDALGGKRKFTADFEIYDERAIDPQNTALDIYIGVDY